MGNVFEEALAQRQKDQDSKKAALGLQEGRKVNDQIHLSIPRDLKIRFLNHCEANYISPSAQLRAWIDQNCK